MKVNSKFCLLLLHKPKLLKEKQLNIDTDTRHQIGLKFE